MSLDLSPPAHDRLEGMLLHAADAPDRVMVVGEWEPADSWDIVAAGSIVLCYGLSYLHQPDDILLPQWAYDDFQREYHGEDALSFILRRGDAFPRADVAGRRVLTGRRDQRFFKEMDIAARLKAVAYRSLEDSAALGAVSTLIWIEKGREGISARMEDDERLTPWMRLALDCYVAGSDDLPRLLDRWPAA